MQIDVKKVFADKNPALARLIPNFVFSYLRRIVHEDELNEFMSEHGHLRDIELVKAGIEFMGIKYQVYNKSNILQKGRNIFVSNHPLGGLDGLVFMLELSKYYDDVKFPVNDILMNVGNMEGIFLPINKHGSQARESARLIEEAYESDAQILYFPAGLCSRKRKGKICDLTWHKSFIAKAIKHKRNIVPVFFSGENSNRFYRLANIRTGLGLKYNIEMLYLPDEMFRQKDNDLNLVIGKVIPWETFDKTKSHIEWADYVKKISYSLNKEIPN